MKTQWQVRPPYFTRPGPYTFKVDGEKIEFTADEKGCFEFDGEPPAGLGIFANRIGAAKMVVVTDDKAAIRARMN
ncbi:MAG: hypothetical protein WC670_18910 [Pseudolabrys sp.]|jgi:hypothetical protein